MQKQASNTSSSIDWYFLYRHYLMDALLFVAILSVQPVLKKFLIKEVVNTTNDINHYSPAVGWLYISAALLQGIGSLLVQKQVAIELQKSRPSYRFIPLIAMVIMHFIIFGVLFWTDGIKYIHEGSIPFWSYLLMFFPTIAAVLVIIPGSKPQAPLKTKIDFLLAFVGTLMLAFSALVVLTLFWNLFMEDLGKEFFNVYSTSKQSAIQIILNKSLVTLLFAALFLLFYAPSRMVFLATDWYKRNTWISMLIIFMPFAISLWIGK